MARPRKTGIAALITPADLERVRRELGLTDGEIGAALGGISHNTVNNYRRGTKPISSRFSDRFRAWLAAGTKVRPEWRPDANVIPFRVLVGGYLRQCPECRAEWQAGERDEPDTWWWYAARARVYCSREHQKAARARRRASKNQSPL